MSLPIALTLIIAGDALVIALVTFVMARAKLLSPHVPAGALSIVPQATATRETSRRRPRAPRPLRPTPATA